ncbi:MAG: beta-eliminating lyase-related protein [Slackia sp.]|nr:beta-eliminating lyase-related protein [Slackia sp.]
MHSFRNDYMEGAHPAVLDALVRTNAEQHPGYTEDAWCEKARRAIKREIARSDERGALSERGIDADELDVEFVAGGTMANLVSIAACLRPHECAIAAPDGHINVHETGAIEACGHKVLVTDDADGLLSVAGVDDVMKEHLYGSNFHMVKPRLLYLSIATETGLVPTAADLRSLRAYADEHDLLIFIDGARLACGLASQRCDASLADVCAAADIFTIGGTKNGALFGEAIVIRNRDVMRDFRFIMKQKGAVTAKGRLLGVQFDALFSTTGAQAGVEEAIGDEPLYFSLGRHAVAAAMALRETLVRHGFDAFASDSSTNQQFLLLDNERARAFMRLFDADEIAHPDSDHTVVRMTCSWATRKEDVEAVDRELARMETA